MSQILPAFQAMRRNWAAYSVITAGLLLQVLLATRGLDFLLTNLLPDDAFYYFQIARHIVEGAGSTFDGLHPTNGYHPLWMAVLLPIFSVFSIGGVHDVAPLYAALGVSIVLNAVTALAVLAIISRLSQSPAVRAFAMLMWSLNPFIIFESLNGLETSLALCLFTIFIFLALRAAERDTGYFLAAIVAGLMILARLDMAVYLAAFLLWLLVRFGWKGGLQRAIPAGLLATAVVSPWFLWNYANFGMLLTSASNGNQLVNHALIVQDHGTSFFQAVKAVFYSLVIYAMDVLERTGAAWLVFASIGALIAALAASVVKMSRRFLNMPLLLALFGGFLVLFLVNAGIRFTGRSWYFVSFNLFVALGAAWMLGRLYNDERKRVIAGLLLAPLVLVSFFLGWYGTLRDQFVNGREMYAMAEWMNKHLPEDELVGVFNAGVQGYFSHVTVVNLDGLVNNSAHDAMREYKLWSYIEEEKLRYISDFDIYLTYRYKSFFDVEDVSKELEEIHRIDMTNSARLAEGIALYRISGSSEADKEIAP